LEKYFHGYPEIELTAWATPGQTGKFEVEVNGQLVHSKITGEGFVDSMAKLEKIMAAIEKCLSPEMPKDN